MIYRILSPQEQEQFRQDARRNYQPFNEIDGAWHPVYQAECVKINFENANFVSQDLPIYADDDAASECFGG